MVPPVAILWFFGEVLHCAAGEKQNSELRDWVFRPSRLLAMESNECIGLGELQCTLKHERLFFAKGNNDI